MKRWQWLLSLTVMVGVVNAALYTYYHKWAATWGPAPVLLCALTAGAAAFWGVGKLGFFTGYHLPDVPGVMVGIIVAGLIMCTWGGGLYFTEPVQDPDWQTNHHVEAPPHSGDRYHYFYGGSRAGSWYYASDFDFGNGDSGSGTDVDADIDGEGLLVLVFIVLLLVLIIGSFVVPHFWILAGMVVLALLVRFTLHQYLAEQDRPSTAPGGYRWR